jgi:hypothetical protein
MNEVSTALRFSRLHTFDYCLRVLIDGIYPTIEWRLR